MCVLLNSDGLSLKVLDPEKTGKKRLIPIGKKKVPALKERFFGFVQAVSDNVEDLTGGMGKESHDTATSGTRTTQAARVAAEGEALVLSRKLLGASYG